MTICNCSTQNRLRELLIMAKFNHAVPTHAILMKMTEKLLTIDAIIEKNVSFMIARKEEALRDMDCQAQKEGMTQNKLRELLAMAKLNEPVLLQVMMINKTEKM
ncbi:MAG: hypothetical protein BYD32DRAFT_456510 [Podila humilis]|nr:MAG: hypothetical protein BYD32DRAFT_456510 [Podila humilis]